MPSEYSGWAEQQYFCRSTQYQNISSSWTMNSQRKCHSKTLYSKRNLSLMCPIWNQQLLNLHQHQSMLMLKLLIAMWDWRSGGPWQIFVQFQFWFWFFSVLNYNFWFHFLFCILNLNSRWEWRTLADTSAALEDADSGSTSPSLKVGFFDRSFSMQSGVNAVESLVLCSASKIKIGPTLRWSDFEPGRS